MTHDSPYPGEQCKEVYTGPLNLDLRFLRCAPTCSPAHVPSQCKMYIIIIALPTPGTKSIASSHLQPQALDLLLPQAVRWSSHHHLWKGPQDGDVTAWMEREGPLSFPTSESSKSAVLWLLFASLFVLFKYLNKNNSNILVILFSFKKKIFRVSTQNYIFKIEAFKVRFH